METTSASAANPHLGQPVIQYGASPADAAAAVILLHGRGGSADDMAKLAHLLGGNRVCYLIPEAAGHAWYPRRFIAPLASNEPWLSSAISVVLGLVASVREQGMGEANILIGGFSQGACLALESALRRGGKYGGIFALSGGIIGPPGHERTLDKRLDGTPAFLGCSDDDPHIPLERVEASAHVLRAAGAIVTERIYPEASHSIVPDEIEAVRRMVGKVAGVG